MKTDRKIKAEPGSDNLSAVKKVRGSKPKRTSKSNGNHPLATYEHAPIGIVECSPEGKHINVNEELCRMLGYEKSDLIGTGLKDITHEDDYSIDVNLHQQLVAGKIPFYRLEKRYICKDGKSLWVELTRSIVRDAAGNPLYTIGVVLDISERKHVERVLRDSSERLRLATEAARMFVWELDLQNRVYTFSDNFEQVLGFSAGLLPKNSVETVEKLSPAEDVQAFWNAFARAVESHSDLHSLQLRIINPENSEMIWLEANAKIVYNEDGTPKRMFGVAQNITQNKRVEELERSSAANLLAIAEANAKFRTFFDQGSYFAGVMSLDGTLVEANRLCLEFCGFTREDVIGKKFWDCGWWKPSPALMEMVRKGTAQAAEGKLFRQESTYFMADGSERVVDLIIAPVTDETGQLLFLAPTGTDITDRKRVEQILKESVRRQEALYHFVDRLHRVSSFEDVFDAALDAILSALQCDRASILLFDDKDVMRFVAWRGLSDDYRKATDGHSPWKTNEKNPEPICMNDVSTGDLSDSLRAVIQGEGIGALAFIPLVSNGKLIGKFMTYYNTSHVFNEDETELSLTIARQLAFGVDRKRADEKLRQAASFDEAVMSNMGEGLYTVDSEGKVTSMNPAAEKMFGWSFDELRGRRMHDATHYKHPDGMPFPADECAGFQVLHHGQKLVGHEDVFIRKDGTFFDVIYSSSPLWDNGKINGLVVVLSDNTTRKHAEKRLVLLSEISELVRRVEDPNELLFTVSKAVGEHLQVKRCLFNEIDVENDREIVHRDYVKGVESVAGVHKVSDYSSVTSGEMKAGKTVVNYDSKTDPRTALDYERSYVEYGERSYVTVPLMRGNRWVASLWVSDDTPRAWSQEEVSLLETVAERTWIAVEKLRINEALRASEELYRTIARSIPGGGVYVVDKDMRYIVADGSVTEAFGLSRKMLEGHTVSEVFHGKQSARMTERLKRNFAGETLSYETKHNGRVYWTQQAPLSESIGEAIIVTLDITERKQMEEALRESERKFSLIYNKLPFAAALSRPEDGIIVDVNEAFERVFGYIKEDVINKNSFELSINPDSERRASILTALQTQGFVRDLELELFTKPKGERVFLLNLDLVGIGGEKYILQTAQDITERKLAEDALRQSEERFMQFMEHLPGLAWIKDIQGRYVYANATAEKAFRTPREKLYGKTDDEVFPPDVAAQFMQNDQQAVLGEKGIQVVETLAHDDGVVHYSLVSKFPIPGPNGNTALIGGTAFDITERKQAEEALKESEQRYRTLFESIDEGFCIIEKVENEPGEKLDFLYVEANPAFAVQAGKGGVVGKTIRQVFPGEPEEWFETYEDILRTGEPKKFERGLVTQGRVLELYAFRVEDGTNRRVAVVFNDITERKQAEEALRESEQRYRDLFDLVPVAVYTCDADGLIQEYNHRAVELWGREPARNDPKEKYCGSFKIYYPDGRFMPHETCPMARMLNGETLEPHELEIIIERPDGTRRNVLAHPFPIKNQRGEIVEAINCLYDITERKQAEDALQQLNLELEHRVRERTSELQAMNESLQEEINERRRVELALDDSRKRLQVLSQRLVEVQEEERRAIARELHDRVGQTLSALNINMIIMRDQLSPDSLERVGPRLDDSMHLVGETITLVRDVMSNLRPAVLDDYGLEAALQSHVDEFRSRYSIRALLERPARPIPRLGPSIEMTVLRIAQEALINIARHAHASEVTLTLRQEDNSFSMTIQDNGNGIQSWQHANRPGSHGLTIMRERAEAFGGNLTVASLPGKGTRIEVSIPVGMNNQDEAQKEVNE